MTPDEAPEVVIDIMTIETRLRPSPADGYVYPVPPSLGPLAAPRWAVTVYVANLGRPIPPAWHRAGYRLGRTHVVAWVASYKDAQTLRMMTLNTRKHDPSFLPTRLATLGHAQESR